jgi:hypothetical protein
VFAVIGGFVARLERSNAGCSHGWWTLSSKSQYWPW